MFISQRQFPQLSQLEIRTGDDEFIINPAGNRGNTCIIPFQPQTEEICNVTVWNDTMQAVKVSEAIDQWLSDHLGFEVKLVFMPDETRRLVNPKYASHGEIVHFADGYPLMLIGQSSLDDLNTRLEQNVSMQRFRPNLVIKGGTPFAEDHWKHLIIDGAIHLTQAKPCARCVMVNIDPQTGEKGTEVLKTLANYRKTGHKVMFGQNLLIRRAGLLREGTEVEISAFF